MRVLMGGEMVKHSDLTASGWLGLIDEHPVPEPGMMGADIAHMVD